MFLVVHRLAAAGDEVHVNIQKEVLSGVSLIGSLPPFSFSEGSFAEGGLACAGHMIGTTTTCHMEAPYHQPHTQKTEAFWSTCLMNV